MMLSQLMGHYTGGYSVPMIDALSGVAIAIIILVSAGTFVPGAKVSSGELMAFVTALLMAFEPAKRLSQMRVSLKASFVGVRMMFDILDRPDAMKDAEGCVDLPLAVGEVALRGVTFSYDGRRDALNDMTLIFPAGKTTALVGPSGGGKSTIMSLLLRLYDPNEGARRSTPEQLVAMVCTARIPKMCRRSPVLPFFNPSP
jgi:ATP-binding cassette subfamily B protein